MTKINLKPMLIPLNRRQPPQALTGINGLDIITEGGLPKGRDSLICGGTGTGKTLLAMEFLLRGAQQFHEAGNLKMIAQEKTRQSQLIASIELQWEKFVTLMNGIPL